MDATAHPTVFISYSHQDEAWKNRLVKQLRVLQLEGDLEVWDDRRIDAGDDWKPQIESAMANARAAVLLISADFLISKFIRENEVLELLRRRESEGLRVIPLIVHPCPWQAVKWLSSIQCRPTGGRELASFTKPKADKQLSVLALEIRDLLQSASEGEPPKGKPVEGAPLIPKPPEGATAEVSRSAVSEGTSNLLPPRGGLENHDDPQTRGSRPGESRRSGRPGTGPPPADRRAAKTGAATWALPASSLSLASAFVFLVTLVFLLRSREMRALFMLPRGGGLATSVLASVVAWFIVVWCSRRPGRLWPRLWALFVAGLCTASVILLVICPEVTWVSALTVTGAAAALTLLPHLARLPPDSSMIPKIALLAPLLVLAVVLPVVAFMGESIAASKQERIATVIEQLGRWTAEVQAVSSRDWTGGGWEDASRAVEGLSQIQPAANLDLSVWREAFILGRDQEVAEETRKLLQATIEGFDPQRVPRISRLHEPAFYYDSSTKRWEESSVFPTASATVGRYFQELGRIFQELNLEVAFASAPLAAFKQDYLEESRPRLEAYLRPQMAEWTDNWAIFRIPGREALLGYSEMPLGKLLQSSVPGLGIPAADLPGLLSLSFQSVRNLNRIPGCRLLAPYTQTEYGEVEQFSRLDCFSYAPRKDTLGAFPRVEMSLVYKLWPNRYNQKPSEVYFLFPLPEGRAEHEFQKQVTLDLAEAVREATHWEVASINRSGSTENGFSVRGKDRMMTVYRATLISLYENRRAVQVRAESWDQR